MPPPPPPCRPCPALVLPAAGGMVDGRLLAAYRCLFEAAAAAAAAGAAAGQQQGQQGQVLGLGSNWGQHLRLAVAARCRQILQGMPSPLLSDLDRLAGWEQSSGAEPHCWAASQQHYAAAIGAYEARHGSLHSAGSDGGAGSAPAAAAAAGSAFSDSSRGSSSSSDSSGSSAGLLDAGSDAALAQLLLQQARAQEGQGAGRDSSTGSIAASSSPDGSSSTGPDSGSILPLLFRCYKKQVLWDAVLLGSEE